MKFIRGKLLIIYPLLLIVAFTQTACKTESHPVDDQPEIEQPELDPPSPSAAYSTLSNGRDNQNVEFVVVDEKGTDQSASLEAFTQTLYPLLKENCSQCHSAEVTTASGAQAPLIADIDPELAHEYALTQVFFESPELSRISQRLKIDRHHCQTDCATAGATFTAAIQAWNESANMQHPEVPRGTPENEQVSTDTILEWIQQDSAELNDVEAEFIEYASLHELHNKGASARELNRARVAVSKALNSTARWAPHIVNPVDVNGKGILYKFDIRDYWGYTLIETSEDFQLYSGISDDELAFFNKLDIHGNILTIADIENMHSPLRSEVAEDPQYARLAWQRVLHGSVESSANAPTSAPNIEGFYGERSTAGNDQLYVKAQDLKFVEAAQLVFTLTRPDVYNSIMSIPGYGHYLEEQLGVDKSQGPNSYDYLLTYEGASIDARLMWRAKLKSNAEGYFWKNFNTHSPGDHYIDELYDSSEFYSPFWEQPIPIFIGTDSGETTADKFSMIATRKLGPGGVEGGGFFTGMPGGQQSMQEMLWSLPNGLQGYAIYGGYGQRRIDMLTFSARDPKLFPEASDEDVDNLTGQNLPDRRYGVGGSCMGCHTSGPLRANNDLRDWLEEQPELLPAGEHGVDGWLNNAAIVEQVRTLYPDSKYMRSQIERDRSLYLGSMAEIREEMILGEDKNIYVESTSWVIDWAWNHYGYATGRTF